VTEIRGTITVAIVEEEESDRTELRRSIRSASNVALIAEYDDPEVALEGLRSLHPDVIVTELTFSKIDGPTFVERLKLLRPKSRILAFTRTDDSGVVFRAVQNGSLGYIMKGDPEQNILSAVSELMRGGSPMTRTIGRRVVEFLQFGIPRREQDHTVVLTYRENQIMQCWVAGMKAREIAKEFSIRLSTVRSHLRQLYQKWQVNSRAECILKFFEGSQER
jgi:two-component system, NarL family, response regulator LiaR